MLEEQRVKLAEEQKKGRKTLVEIQREEAAAAAHRRAEEQAAGNGVSNTGAGFARADAIELLVAVTVKQKQQKHKKTAVVVPAVESVPAPLMKNGFDFKGDDVDEVTRVVNEETRAKIVDDLERKKALERNTREEIRERRYSEKLRRLERKVAAAKSRTKAAATVEELFVVHTMTCKHSANVAVESCLCETDREKKARLQQRNKAQEVSCWNLLGGKCMF